MTRAERRRRALLILLSLALVLSGGVAIGTQWQIASQHHTTAQGGDYVTVDGHTYFPDLPPNWEPATSKTWHGVYPCPVTDTHTRTGVPVQGVDQGICFTVTPHTGQVRLWADKGHALVETTP